VVEITLTLCGLGFSGQSTQNMGFQGTLFMQVTHYIRMGYSMCDVCLLTI